MGDLVNARSVFPVCILLVLAVLTAVRAEVWRTPGTLWRDAAAKSPLRPRPHFNVGTVLMSEGRYDDALAEYQKAELLSLRDGTPRHEREMTQLLVAMNIGDVLIRQGRFEEAHQVLKQAWIANPGFPGYAVNLSTLYLRMGEPQKATLFLADGIAHLKDYRWFPKKGDLYVNLGVAMQMRGECEAAREAYALARHYAEQFKEPACS